MAIRKFSEAKLTAEVLRRIGKSKDKRTRAVMTSFIKHAHAFVREVKPTPEEWFKAIEFLIETGKWCDGKRNEFILLSDTQGISMLVDAINYKAGGGATESTVLGPFHRQSAPQMRLGESISRSTSDGEPCIVSGTVKDTRGRPVPGAKLDVWQAGADGFYDSQKGEAMNLRGIFTADAEGKFFFGCVKPEFYPVPHDGPAGRLLEACGRHPMRPAHLHFWITARGCKPLVTHLFVKGSKYLDSDAVFGVKPDLIIDFKRGKDGISRAHYDFVLMPEASARTTRGKPSRRGTRGRRAA